MNKINYLLGIFIAVATSAQAQLTTINWDFTDGDTTFDNGSPVHFTVSDLTVVNSSLSINSTSPSGGYTGASGSNNAAVSAVSGPFDVANSTYYTFTLTPNSGFAINAISFSFGSRSTSSGPVFLSLRSSVDGYASDLDSAVASNDSSWNLYSFSFNTTGGVDTPVTFRLYGSDGSSTASNWRIDDFNLTTQAVVPEPAAWADLLMGASLLGGAYPFRRRRS
jgi:PEP-CTERM motif